jgi:hypothetical protein
VAAAAVTAASALALALTAAEVKALRMASAPTAVTKCDGVKGTGLFATLNVGAALFDSLMYSAEKYLFTQGRGKDEGRGVEKPCAGKSRRERAKLTPVRR